MKKYKLICMSFDGEYQTESPRFENIQDAWEYSNDLGSKWYFYPFHFVCTDKTIADTGYGTEHLIGKRITTIQKYFKKVSERSEMKGCNVEEFWFAL